jgi:hypothetical protein
MWAHSTFEVSAVIHDQCHDKPSYHQSNWKASQRRLSPTGPCAAFDWTGMIPIVASKHSWGAVTQMCPYTGLDDQHYTRISARCDKSPRHTLWMPLSRTDLCRDTTFPYRPRGSLRRRRMGANHSEKKEMSVSWAPENNFFRHPKKARL